MRSTIVGILVNALLAIVKGAAGFLGNSYALVADAIESSADVLSSLIVFSGLRIAAKPRDDNHPYGHGKAEPLAAAIVSIALIGAAVMISVQSVHEIITPHHAPEPFTLAVLVLVIMVKEGLFRYVFDVGQQVGSTAVKTDAFHHRSDAITSAAAFVGIAVALVGGAGWESSDDWAALFAAVIIFYNAYRLFVPAIAEVMDAAPPRHIEERVRLVAQSVEGVIGLDKCLVRKLGFDLYVDLHVVVSGDISVRKGHEIGHSVRDAICKDNQRIVDVLIHIEPEEELNKSGRRITRG
ncbi:cation transporter [Candidatus Saccharibacteria bacterium]|nr:cation transporter [Candidatus Saccharibacteria bacterium]